MCYNKCVFGILTYPTGDFEGRLLFWITFDRRIAEDESRYGKMVQFGKRIRLYCR